MVLMKQRIKSTKDHTKKRGVFIIEVDEPVFDIDYTQPAEREFQELMDFHYIVKKIALDFSKVEELTASGAGVILSMYLKCYKKGIAFKVFNLKHYVSESLDELGVLNLIKIPEKEPI